MERIVKERINNWNITLQRNVHMYCHALSMNNGDQQFNIDCEDLPTEEKTIGIWLYTLKAPEKTVKELQSILLEWANGNEVKFQIYTSKDQFITSKQGA